MWLLYVVILLGVSLTSKRREVAEGKEECFHEICLKVEKTDVMPGYLARNGERVVRVTVRMTNRSAVMSHRNAELSAYLLDAQGRRWREVPGLEGVRLTTTMPPGASVMSQPVFVVSKDATDLSLVLTRGWSLPGLLVIGDPDSLMHAPVAVPLHF
jgi:hypothetical protein